MSSAYDYSKLRGRIIERCKTMNKLSKKTGIKQNSLSNKINGRTGWSQPEIEIVCKALGIPKTQVWDYFFVKKEDEE